MLLSTSMDMLFYNNFTFDETVDILGDAGFDAIDFSIFFPALYGEETDSESFKSKMIDFRKKAESRGMCFNQSHAPMPSNWGNEKQDEERFKDITRAMRNASYLGVKNIVVHPVKHIDYDVDGNQEKLFLMNMEFYGKLKPYCEEYNIKVAVENMFGAKGLKNAITHSTCSKPDEFIRYVDALDPEWFVACLDTGHACLVKEDVADIIRKLGGKRLKALHVHDNDGVSDMHTVPYQGLINWDKVAEALKEINYEGDFTFEVSHFFHYKIPRELYLPTFKYIAQIGRHIMNKIK